jgi:energy-converting hydrogenase Eha subunit A
MSRPPRLFASKGGLTLGLAWVLASVTLGLAIWDEPLHIDELRQVGFYSGGLRSVVGGALAQTQPPLDYMIGAGMQWLMWPAKVVWRLPGVVFALLGAAALGALNWRFRQGGWLLIGLLATAPVFLEFSAYARPYALPFFLMMSLLWGFERWRSTRKWPYLAVGAASALALPLSRTTETPLFLLITLITLLLIRRLAGEEQTGWTRLPMLFTAIGLVGSAVVLPFVRTGSFRAEGVNGPGTIITRLWSDIVPLHASYAPLGVFGLVLGSVGLAVTLWSVTRRRAIGSWWMFPLVLTVLGSPIVFAALSRADQPYFDRYAYFAAPAIALGIALIVARARSDAVVALAGLGLLLAGAATAVVALNEVHRADYEQAAGVAEELIDQGNVVVFEQESTLGDYRPAAFPGASLFLPGSPHLVSTDQAARGEARIETGRRPVLLVQGPKQSIDGWTAVEAADGFHVLKPDADHELWDELAQAEALWSACQGLSPDNGSLLCVMATQLAYQAGDMATAQAYATATLDRIGTPVVKDRMTALLDDISPELVR